MTTTPVPEALRLAARLTEGAWHKMTRGDVEAVGRELRRLHALAASAPVAPTPPDWRELCRRLYVELFHCDKQMTCSLNEDGEPIWRTGTGVRDVLSDAKAALEANPTTPEAAPVAPSPQPAMFDNVELPDVDDMAHSALQEALSFGLDHNVIARFGKSVMQKTQAAMLAEDTAYRDACSLAEALFKKHFAHQPDYASGKVIWGVCDTTASVISQIDNMVCGLVEPLQQGEYLPLPAPNHRGPCGTGSYFDAYTAEQMHAYVDADRAARGAAQAAPLTDTFVQTVPDKCDRIVWRNNYYHLPIAAAPKADHIEDDLAMVPAPLQQGEYPETLYEGGRESVDDALAVVESFGPGVQGLNDTFARQVLLGQEVRRLRAAYEHACQGRSDFRNLYRAARGAAQAAPAEIDAKSFQSYAETRAYSKGYYAGKKAAQAAPALPAGWVPLTITHEGDQPEEVAFGPQIMMDRLKKWLDRYFAMLAAPAVEQVDLVGVRPNGDHVNLGKVAMPPRMKARELATEQFGHFTDDDGSDAELCFYALEQFLAWLIGQGWGPAPVAEDAEIRKALHDAATSLETISRIAGKDPYMLEMVDVRLYAAARAKVARDAQAAQPEGCAT